jgi:hypothetical protein
VDDLYGMSEAEVQAEYDKAVHAMQSAVAMEISARGANAAAANPKHLRVGINNAMADHGALAELLMAKGIFTGREYMEAIVRGARRERDRMTDHVRATCGLPDTITFG